MRRPLLWCLTLVSILMTAFPAAAEMEAVKITSLNNDSSFPLPTAMLLGEVT